MAERFGRYTLLKRLGSGGMGEVFLARPVGAEGTDRFVVVKTLLPSLAEDEELVMMFLSEARLAAQLDHPNVCRVLDLGLEDGVLFMTLELIRGVDLEKLQRDIGGARPPVQHVARIIADAAKGLHHAHELVDERGTLVGLIHRDVSPHNLLVTYDGEVKVIDFGLAKTVGRAQQSHTGSLKGKFAYMSPEQVRGERIDRRIDVFALGIVLWELLTGERLFRRDSDVATIAAIAQFEVPAPSQRNPEVPPELDALVLQALAKDRLKRFQSAGELATALERFLSARGHGSQQALGAWMRAVYREQLAREARSGLLGDAPDGPVMKLRRLPGPQANGAQILVKAPPPSDVSSEAQTEEALFGPDGMPLPKGSVLLAPRPEMPTQRTRLAAAPLVRSTLAKVPPPVPMKGEDAEEERTVSVPGLGAAAVKLSPAPRFADDGREAFDEPTRRIPVPTRPRPVNTAPLAPRVRPAPQTVPLAPAHLPAAPAQHTTSQRRWIGLGIGLAVVVVATAVVLIAVL